MKFAHLLQNGGPMIKKHTLPETNIAPENGWLEDWKISFLFGVASL